MIPGRSLACQGSSFPAVYSVLGKAMKTEQRRSVTRAIPSWAGCPPVCQNDHLPFAPTCKLVRKELLGPDAVRSVVYSL